MLEKTKIEEFKNLLRTSRDITQVDFSNENYKQALIELCEVEAEFRSCLNAYDDDHCAVLLALAKKSYRIVESFAPQQLVESVVLEYLNQSLKETDVVKVVNGQNAPTTREKRYGVARDGYPVIKLNYQTTSNNAIFYQDQDLHLVTYLLSNIDLYIKITSAINFCNFLDCPLNTINMQVAVDTLRRYMVESIREVLCDMIVDRQIGFYHFVNEFGNIERAITGKINNVLGTSGVKVADCAIKSITIPDNIVKEIQAQTFILSKSEREKKAALAYEQESLELFERKLATLNKYGFEDGLTEAEKDNAFQRYIAKVNNIHTDEKFDVAELDDESKELYGKKRLNKPTAPTAPLAPNDSRHATLVFAIIGLVLGIVLTIIGISEQTEWALIFGIIIFLVGCACLVLYLVRKSRVADLVMQYKANLKQYENDRKIYEEQLKAYNEENKNQNS